MDDKEKIAEFRTAFAPYLKIQEGIAADNLQRMKVSVEEGTILHKPLSKHFSIYCIPKGLILLSVDSQ